MTYYLLVGSVIQDPECWRMSANLGYTLVGFLAGFGFRTLVEIMKARVKNAKR